MSVIADSIAISENTISIQFITGIAADALKSGIKAPKEFYMVQINIIYY